MDASDWAAFAAVLAAMFSAVAYAEVLKRRAVAAEDEGASFADMMLMGRRMTLPVFVATLVATWYGGIFGVTQIAFKHGVFNFVTQGLFWYGIYIFFALALVPRLRSRQAMTLPELVGGMFGPRSAKLAGVLTFCNVLPIAHAISIGLFLRALFGWGLPAATAAGVGLVVLYSFHGGLRAVVFSDVVQFVAMCLAVLLVLIYSVLEFGGPAYLRAALPASHFSPTGGQGLAATMVWGLIALATLIDPAFYQRCFAAESDATARKGILLATAIWVCFDVCTTAGAMYARAALPEADPAQGYLVYAVQLLPHGLRGILLGGVLATILSTLDSFLLIASVTVAYDLAPEDFKRRVWVHRAALVLVGVLSVLLAGVFGDDIQAVWLALGSFYAASLLLPVLYGYAFPGALSDGQFVRISLLGWVATACWRLAPRSGRWALIDALYIGLAASAAGLLAAHLETEKKRPAA